MEIRLFVLNCFKYNLNSNGCRTFGKFMGHEKIVINILNQNSMIL
jgi:hypothetical protein